MPELTDDFSSSWDALSTFFCNACAKDEPDGYFWGGCPLWDHEALRNQILRVFCARTNRVLLVSIVRLVMLCVQLMKTIPNDLWNFLSRIALKWKPIVFVATLYCLVGCFHELTSKRRLRSNISLIFASIPSPTPLWNELWSSECFSLSIGHVSLSENEKQALSISLSLSLAAAPVSRPRDRHAAVDDGNRSCVSASRLARQVSGEFVIGRWDANPLPITMFAVAIDSLTRSLASSDTHASRAVFSLYF